MFASRPALRWAATLAEEYEDFGAQARGRSPSAVSYTHLTLPTSDLV